MMPAAPSLAVHHQCFRDQLATDFAISRFRKHHPELPYHLWSDAGADFTEIAKKHNAYYSYSSKNVGHSLYSSEQLLELLKRIKSTAVHTGADLILWMEDDVLTRGRLNLPWGTKAGCFANTGNNLWPECIALIKDKYKVDPKQTWFGMAGGALINGDLFRNKWGLVEEFSQVDYPSLINSCGSQVGYGDVILQMIHLIADIPCLQGGYVIDINERLFRNTPFIRRLKKWRLFSSPLVHGYKKHYGK
jgi:hypothetical protein